MTVHLPLASYAGVFRRARPSSLVGRDERRAPLKTPAWEANLLRDPVKFCVIFKDFVWATWGSDMKIVLKFAWKFFYSSEKSGNLATKAQKNYKKTTLDKLPRIFFREIVQMYLVLPSRVSWFSNVPRGRAEGITARGGGGGAGAGKIKGR